MTVCQNISFPTISPLAALRPSQKTTYAFYACCSKLEDIGAKTTSFFKRVLYENSIFFALDNEAIAKHKEKYKDLNWRQKFTLGVKTGLETVTVITAAFIFSAILLSVAENTTRLLTGKRDYGANDGVTLWEVLSGAVYEEILFRGIFQNGIRAIQNGAAYIAPTCVKENRVFKWITSPAARILVVNSLFAAIHLLNAGGYLSVMGAIVQVALIFFMPTESILHETTGSIFAPLGAHLANNAVIGILA